MRSLTLFLILFHFSATFACDMHEKKDKEASNKGLDADRIECSWNKTSKEADEKCKPDPNKPTIAQKLDKQLNKDAKTLKKFFGVKGGEETEAPKAEPAKK